MSDRRRGVVPLVFIALLSALPAFAGAVPEVAVHGPPSGWATRFASPLRIEVRNGTGDLHVVTGRKDYEVRSGIALSGASSEFVEATLFRSYGTRIEWSLSGMEGSDYVNPSSASRVNGGGGHFLCVNGAWYRELQTAIAAARYPSDWQAQVIPSAELPRKWQAYAGLSVSLVLEETDARALDREQREALRLWLTWMGGRLWLIGSDGEELLREWGWRPLGSAEGKISGLCMGTGTVFCREASNAAGQILDAPYSFSADLLHRMGISDAGDVPMDLSEDLGGFSIGFIVACLVVLGVVLGPVNYWFVRRRGNALLFYLVTPLVAGLGSLAIIGGTLVAEGGTRSREVAVLYHYGDGNDAFVIDRYGVRPGLFGRSLTLPEETLLIPERNWGNDAIVVDMAGREARVNGLLRPRAVSEYTLASPAAGRMRVTAKWDVFGCSAENGLGYEVQWLVASDGKGRFSWGRDIPAGGEIRLQGSRIPEDIAEKLAETPGVDKWSGPARVVTAEASGMPYIEDGGLGAGRLSARYFFVGVEAAEGSHE